MNAGRPLRPRAARYPLKLPLRFRIEGDSDWSYGMTVNLSSTGVLFRAEWIGGRTPHLDAEIELPADRESSLRIVGRGVVVRGATSADDPGDRTFAMTWSTSRLVRSETG